MDTAYFPYGVKSKEFLIKRSIYLVRYLISIGVDKVILACNTLSITAFTILNELFPNKIIDVFNLVQSLDYSDKVLIASAHTIKMVEQFYPKIVCLEAQKLINTIEKNTNVEEELEKLLLKIDINKKVVLGCTHFIKIKTLFLNRIQMISEDDLFLEKYDKKKRL